MERLWHAIRKAETLDELLALMAVLSRRTEALLDERLLREDEILSVLPPLATLRQLLAALAARKTMQVGSAEQALIAGSLSERYGALEGRLKELRNDHARAEREHAA